MYPLGAGDSQGMLAKLGDPHRLDAAISDRLRVASRIVLNHTGGLSYGFDAPVSTAAASLCHHAAV